MVDTFWRDAFNFALFVSSCIVLGSLIVHMCVVWMRDHSCGNCDDGWVCVFHEPMACHKCGTKYKFADNRLSFAPLLLNSKCEV